MEGRPSVDGIDIIVIKVTTFCKFPVDIALIMTAVYCHVLIWKTKIRIMDETLEGNRQRLTIFIPKSVSETQNCGWTKEVGKEGLEEE